MIVRPPCLVCHLVVAAALLTPAAAQTPAFDAASVRPSASNRPGADVVFQPGGRFVASNADVVDLIAEAYGVETFRVVGGPAWIRTDDFEVQAQAGANGTVEQTRLMLRTLLADRFKLRARTESRDIPIYALVLSRGDRRTGPRLQASPATCVNEAALPCGRLFQNPGWLRGRSVPISMLATRLSAISGRVVADRTGLTGLFDIDAEWAPQDFDPNRPGLFTAITEQLGLRLEPATGPADVVVVDGVERPTEN